MILASLFLWVGMALAQTEVSGVIVSAEDGLPIIGATVMVKGTNVGTSHHHHYLRGYGNVDTER